MLTKAEFDWVIVLWKAHPASHRVDDVLVSVHSCVCVLFPVTTITLVVAAWAIIECLLVWNRLGAAVALVTGAVLAVTETIWEALWAIIHEGIRRKNSLDHPITIRTAEELLLKVSMLVDIFLLDKDGAFIAHVSWGRSWVLIIMAVILSYKSLRWNLPRAAFRELFWISTFPDLDFVDVIITKSSTSHLVFERFSKVVNTIVANQKLHLATHDDFKVGHEIFRQISATQVILNILQDHW